MCLYVFKKKKKKKGQARLCGKVGLLVGAINGMKGIDEPVYAGRTLIREEWVYSRLCRISKIEKYIPTAHCFCFSFDKHVWLQEAE